MRQLGLDVGGTDLKLALLEYDRVVSTKASPTRSENGGPTGSPRTCRRAAVAAIRQAAEFLGIAVANLTLFVTPERVVVGGGVAEAGDLLFVPLRAEVARRIANVAPLGKIEIVPAELGPYAGAIGAALHGPGPPS